MEGPVKKTTVDLQSSSAGSWCTTGSQEYGRLHLVDMHPSSGDPTTCTCSCLANSLVETEWYVGCMYGTYKYNPFCATSIHGDASPHTNYILHILSSSSTSTIYQLQVCLTSSSTRAGMEGDNADKEIECRRTEGRLSAIDLAIHLPEMAVSIEERATRWHKEGKRKYALTMRTPATKRDRIISS